MDKMSIIYSNISDIFYNQRFLLCLMIFNPVIKHPIMSSQQNALKIIRKNYESKESNFRRELVS